jgi:hypothetical protein
MKKQYVMPAIKQMAMVEDDMIAASMTVNTTSQEEITSSDEILSRGWGSVWDDEE